MLANLQYLRHTDLFASQCHLQSRVQQSLNVTYNRRLRTAAALSRSVLQTHTYTHPFNGPISRTTQESRYQKGKTNLDFTEARDSEWQWNQLDRMQVCTSLQTDNHTSTPPLSFFTGRMPFLPPNQQRQSTEGKQKRPTKQNVNRDEHLKYSLINIRILFSVH